MKVMWVSNYLREEGRGPLFRLLNMMESMSKICELTLASFGPMDSEVQEQAKKLGVPFFIMNYEHSGWFVNNSDEIANKIVNQAIERKIDIVVLTWEIWDIATAIENKIKDTEIEYAVVMHSIPFAGMLRTKSAFRIDIFRRVMKENQLMIKKYLLTKTRKCQAYIKKMNIITMTSTVEQRLKEYFNELSLFTAYPGYAVNVKRCDEPAQYDFSFMARFEQGKGIYRLIKILKYIKKKKTDFSLVMIGTFTYKNDEMKFKRLLQKYNLINNVVFTGWLDDEVKYHYLEASKIFVYPSYEGDTFSISCLEALGIGKKIVCYNVPFVKCNYAKISGVYPIKPFDDKLFANKCLELIGENNLLNLDGIEFVKQNYSSWEQVAQAEYACYLRIVKGEKINVDFVWRRGSSQNKKQSIGCQTHMSD